MSALYLFEEIRFITELVIAEQMLLWRFAKRKEGFWLKSILWNVSLLFMTVLLLVVRLEFANDSTLRFKDLIYISWYIFLALLTIVQIKHCYEITFSDQYSVFQISLLSKEKEIVKQLLYERQKQYQLSKENIEIINHKCHDLKHQIHALRQANRAELDHYINEVEESIMLYDHVLKTDNEVLNTILSEKSLYCEKHQVKLTCIIDSSQLDFMSTLDIYALLGNALDNAIECVRKYQDIEKRVISLNISAKGGCLCIQTNNYYEGTLQFEDGLPLTTKETKAYHGFGMKSMQHLTRKYGGTMYTQLENGIFMLQIVIPMPKEFLRLLNESQELKAKEANCYSL